MKYHTCHQRSFNFNNSQKDGSEKIKIKNRPTMSSSSNNVKKKLKWMNE
jgi:hypothetical protein